MASVSKPPPAWRAARLHRNLERNVLWLGLAGGLPAALVLFYLAWTLQYSFEVRWTLAAIVAGIWIGCALAAFQMVTRALYLHANLLGALREGDYSIRGTGSEPGSAADLVMQEINALGDTLQRQRTEAVESTRLLRSVMGAIDVAVFAFDTNGHVVLANPAAARLIGQPAEALLGRGAHDLRLADYLTGDTPRLIDRPFGPDSGRHELRRTTFRRDGRPHQLLVFADLSRALREEEQQAWQRIVRVLSLEINNSLTPIKSIAHSIKRMLARVPDLPRAGEIREGLNLIETRSGSLGRFLRAYAQLARLPKPRVRSISLSALAYRVAELENRLPVTVRGAGDVEITADPDQLEQLLINLVRNAVDATLETNGRVWIDWNRNGGGILISVEDEGPGLPETANLFVPFFTTKPSGSGIGLALSRQIADAHVGSLLMENRQGTRGCRAVLRLPL